MSQIFISNNEEETKQIAEQIATKLDSGDVVTLNGDLGSGKSFLARYIIKSLTDHTTTVTSPTFNLVQEYKLANGISIYHYDLYRLHDGEEIYELAIEEALSNNICLIEWPDIINHILPQNRMTINIEITGANTRRITVTKTPTF